MTLPRLREYDSRDNDLGLLIAAAAVIFGWSERWRQRERQEITLRKLSALWTKRERKTIHIAELSSLWRDGSLSAGRENDPPALRKVRSTMFMEKFIRHAQWFQKAPLQQKICRHILALLDREGDCPSVVNVATDVEGGWDANTFRLLSRTTLLDHTLNVAEEMVKLLAEAETSHVIPDALIAALGHDLGKLDSMRGYLYSLGEHPVAAGRPLSGVPGFKNLPRKDEILRAIKLHHKMPDGLLGKMLKKADQRARQREMEDAVEQLAGEAEAKAVVPVEPPATNEMPLAKGEKTDSASSPDRVLAAESSVAAGRMRLDLFGGEEAEQKKTGEVPGLIDISRWFDAEEFLKKLKPYINRMFGTRFMAFSMPDGHVFFQAKVLEEVARKEAERAGAMEIAAMAGGDQSMRQVLFTIVHHLRRDHDVIARGLIKDNFFGGYFVVTKKSGKSLKGYYTPFHAEAFGSIAEMENAKPDALREILRVAPYVADKA